MRLLPAVLLFTACSIASVSAESDPGKPVGDTAQSRMQAANQSLSAAQMQQQMAVQAPRMQAMRGVECDEAKAFENARVAAVHAALTLRLDQEGAWAEFEPVLRDKMKARKDDFAQRRFAMRSGILGDAKRMEEDAAREAQVAKAFADAAGRLSAALDPAQARRFDTVYQRTEGLSMNMGTCMEQR